LRAIFNIKTTIMRKTTIIAFTAIALFFYSCSKKDSAPKLSLSATKADLLYNETAQITASIGSNSEYTWSSSDEFVGEVNTSGLFTASHVGETIITAEKSGQKASYKITVSPMETFFTEPFIEIGASMASIKAKEKRTIKSETATGIYYADPSPSIRNGIIYIFDDAGKLDGAIVMFTETTSTASKVGRFYAERYKAEGISDDESIFFFSDNNKRYSLGIDTDADTFGFSAIYIKYISAASAKAAVIQKARDVIKSAKSKIF